MAARTGYVGTQSTGDVLTSGNFDKLPNGLIAYKESITTTSNVDDGGKDLSGLSMTPTFGTSRLCKFECRVRMGGPTGAMNAYVVMRTSGGTEWARMIETFFTAAGANSFIMYGSVLYVPPAGSGTSIKLTGYTSSATETWDHGPGSSVVPDTLGPDYFAVFDLGPAF